MEDASQALKDVENDLRGFIAEVLRAKFGDRWVDECGVTPARIAAWRRRMEAEPSRQKAGAVEERLLYYSDFYDLSEIMGKNWSGPLSEALGSWKRVEVYLEDLKRLRDPDAHRRELLPHQKHLVLGIAAEIRASLAKYRSKQESPEGVFPRLESVRDNLGNIWTAEISSVNWVKTGLILHPGDSIQAVVVATDPEGRPLEYSVQRSSQFRGHSWQPSPEFDIQVRDDDISKCFELEFCIRSDRDWHALGSCDEFVSFAYTVLPRRRTP